jgi:hypothetical protein
MREVHEKDRNIWRQNLKRERPFERSRRKWKDNVNTDVKELKYYIDSNENVGYK